MICIKCEEEVGIYICSRCHDFKHATYCSVKCQKADWKFHKRICYPLSSELFSNKNNIILHKALKMNLFCEYQGYKTISGGVLIIDPNSPRRYGEARNFIYKGIIAMILENPYNAIVEGTALINAKADIKTGCTILKEIEPKTIYNMEDLLWLFIPRSLHQLIIDIYEE